MLDATAVRDIAAAVRAATGGHGADAVIEASGSYQLLHEAIRTAAIAGRVATVSSYPSNQHGLSLGEENQRTGITLTSSMTMGGAPPAPVSVWGAGCLGVCGLSGPGRVCRWCQDAWCRDVLVPPDPPPA